MMKRWLMNWCFVGVVFILAAALSMNVSAQEHSVAHLQARVIVGRTLDLQVAPGTIVFSEEDILQTTLDYETFQHVVVKEATLEQPSFIFRASSFGNVAHSLTIQALPAGSDGTGAVRGLVSDTGEELPWDRLEWRLSPVFHEEADPDDWLPLSAERHVLYSGPALQETAVYLDFRLTIQLTDAVGSYQGMMQFTLSPLD